MSKVSKPVFFLVVFSLLVCACEPGVPIETPIEEPTVTTEGVAIEVAADTTEIPTFWGPTTQEEAVNTGYCPPGNVRVTSGIWESCSGSDWEVIDPLYSWTYRDAFAASLNGTENFVLLPLFMLTTVDPVPGDEIVVMMFKGTIIAILSGQAAMALQNQALWSGNTLEGFQEWEAGYGNDLIIPSWMIEDKVGVIAMESTVKAEDFDIRVPTGSLAIVIEDSIPWASLIVANLAEQGVITVAVYPSCAAWRAGGVKLAHVYVVDQHSEGQLPGHTCLMEIALLTPPPVIIIGYTAEKLDEITDEWSGEESTVRELFEDNRADMVLNKKMDMFELIYHVVHGLTGG